LPHESSAACADGRSNRDFFLPDSRAREQEVGYVGAGDQKYKANRAKQNIEREMYVTDYLAEKRHDADSEPARRRIVGRVLFLHSACDHVHIRLRSIDRDARLQFREDVEIFVTAIGARAFGERQGHKQIGVLNAVDGGHYFFVQNERGGHHSGYSERVAVHCQRFSDHVRIAAECALPESVAQNYARLFSRLIVVGCECAAEYRACAQQGKKRRRNSRAVDMFGSALARKVETPADRDRRFFEDLIVSFDVEVLAR